MGNENRVHLKKTSYSAMNENEVNKFSRKWKNLKNIILNEVI